ncbi:unnamed protein product [Closterium sp. NIES-54]
MRVSLLVPPRKPPFPFPPLARSPPRSLFLRPAPQVVLGELVATGSFGVVELGELVATGSFGVVHKGVYRGQQIAVKFLLFPEASSEDDLNRAKRGFRQEVAVWHKLQHPNVVQFLGAYINPPKWAIVTEFLEGGTVKGFLARIGKHRLPLKQIISMALDIARGMQYLHSYNVIHRDLKSANLLLASDASVKVADFGLARTEAQEPGNMTAETGTIRWMAPEMIDHKPYTRKVDVYSYGIVLWEICTAQWPFEGLSFVQLAHAIVADDLRPPIKDCPSQLTKLITRCDRETTDQEEQEEEEEGEEGGEGTAAAVTAWRRGTGSEKSSQQRDSGLRFRRL